MVHEPSDASDSGNSAPTFSASSCTRSSVSPASTVIVIEASSTSRTRSMRLSDSSTSFWRPSWPGIWPPTRPVLPPCGTSAVFVSAQSLRMSATSCVEPGRTTQRAWPWNSSRGSAR